MDGARRAGIFSEGDLLTRVIGEGRVETFGARRFRHLPVVRAGRGVGILSTRDFLALVVDGLEDYVEKARYEQEPAAGTGPYDHIGGSYGRYLGTFRLADHLSPRLI